jgi:hypothetical protein
MRHPAVRLLNFSDVEAANEFISLEAGWITSMNRPQAALPHHDSTNPHTFLNGTGVGLTPRADLVVAGVTESLKLDLDNPVRKPQALNS